MTTIVAAAVAVVATPPTDPQAGTGSVTIRANASEMLKLADELQRVGRNREAETVLDLLTRDPDPNIRNEARFKRAMMLEAAGRHADAAVLLRRILDDKPDATAVRFKLATILQKLGHEDSALRELRALRASDLPPDIARFVDRYSAALQATKPLGIQIEIALAPDSNINRATRSDTLGTVIGDFVLDEASQARSGVGLAVRGFAQVRQRVSRAVVLVARASSEANLYRRKQFDDVGIDLSFGPEWHIGQTRLSAEAGFGRQWYGTKPFQHSLRLSASAARALDSVSQLRLDGSLRRSRNLFNPMQDGHGYAVRGRYERSLSSDLLILLSGGWDRFRARDSAYSTRSWSAGVALFQTIGRMTLNAGVDVGRLKADARFALLPQARADRLTRFYLGSVFRQLTVAGFAPVARLIIERNRSSVEFYDYKRIRTEFGISRAF